MAAVPSLGRASEVEASPRPREGAVAGELYARHSQRIYRYCLKRLRSREEAEDATQTTFLNAFRGLQRGVTPELEQAWLYKIAENVCLTRVRSNVRRLRVESPTDLDPLHDFVAAPQRQRDELHGIEDALASLPEQQRRAILLREWQGLSYREIADQLGITQGAVETLIFRARRSLARALARGDERRGRLGLRNGANLGSLVAWLKSIALGGSTAVKIAAVIAAGSAVVVAGSDRPTRHAPAKKSPIAARAPVVAAPVAVGAVHLRRSAAVAPAARRGASRETVSTVRAAAPHTSSAPRRWAQRVPRESDDSTNAPSSAAPTDAPASKASASEAEKPHPATPAPAKTEHAPPAKDNASDESQPEKSKPKVSASPHPQPAQPELPPTASPKATENPSAQAPGQLKDKPKKG